MKKPLGRMTANKLQVKAKAAAAALKPIYMQLSEEIDIGTVPAPTVFDKYEKKKPTTVTYSTEQIETIVNELVTWHLELQWWSASPDERSKMVKPFSLRI